MKQRSLILLVAFFFMFGVTGGRLTILATSQSHAMAATRQSLYTLTVNHPRGTVYDRGGIPLTNRAPLYQYAVTATPQIISQIHQQFEGQEKEDLLERLSHRTPMVITTHRNLTLKGALAFESAEPLPYYQPAVHLIGYTDPSGRKGVCGLQKEFEEWLTCTKPVTVTYACDAVGGALSGIAPTVENPTNSHLGGVFTTLDSNLQEMVRNAFPPQKRGAVIVQKAGSGELLACYSAPDFSPQQVEQAMNHSASPLLNRSLSAYNVGSVFKLCVAAAALEAGISPTRTYTCTGEILCSQPFSCHKKEGHGALTMEEALAQSCNTYFIDLAMAVGGEAVFQMAKAMGLGQSLPLTATLAASAGQLPQRQELLRSPAELANFAIGQGVLMATPLHLNGITSVIANQGVYFPPFLVSGVRTEEGVVTPRKAPVGRRILSTQTAYTLRQMMTQVMTAGTGQSGMPQTTTAAGKTATAQTGMVNQNKQPINQGWFTGCCPSENPQYVITVLVEDARSGGLDAAPVFGAICNALFRNEW